MFRRYYEVIGLAVSICTLVAILLFGQNPVQAQSTGIPTLSSVLHILPPVGEKPGHAGEPWEFDWTLTDYLTVTICQTTVGDDCTFIEEFTSQTVDGRLDYIKMQTHQYHVNWYAAQGYKGKDFQIHIAVAGLEVGFVSYILDRNGALPIKFRIDNHPRIRARVLHEQGASAMEIAEVLRDEFQLGADDAAEILLEEGYPGEEVGEAVLVNYGMDAQEGAIFLKKIGCSAREAFDVLMRVFDIQDEVEIEEILYTAGYSPEEFLDFTALGSIRKFAPVLRFDKYYKGLPMSAQTYFQSMLTLTPDPVKGEITWTAGWDGPSPCYGEGRIKVCGRDECNCGMQNKDFSTLTNGEVPTYYQAISDIETTGDGRLRIAYWWFYGFQEHCNGWDVGEDGSHHGDWEKVIVTTNPERTRADAVTYEFHGVWYTRSEYFPTLGDRPFVYVGKLGHGNYHTNENSGFGVGTPWHCCEYADYRNGYHYTTWYTTTENLVSLRGDAEPWMLADRIGSTYRYQGQDYTITKWRWGPHISYCVWRLFGCMDWEHRYACDNHPTTYNLNWNMGSCHDVGCGTFFCKGSTYPVSPFYNEGWP